MRGDGHLVMAAVDLPVLCSRYALSAGRGRCPPGPVRPRRPRKRRIPLLRHPVPPVPCPGCMLNAGHAPRSGRRCLPCREPIGLSGPHWERAVSMASIAFKYRCIAGRRCLRTKSSFSSQLRDSSSPSKPKSIGIVAAWMARCRAEMTLLWASRRESGSSVSDWLTSRQSHPGPSERPWSSECACPGYL